MPLQDHFHPPLRLRRAWTSFHASWATYISADLNRRLPEKYFARANVKFGIEIDVATFEQAGRDSGNAGPGDWAPPEPALTLPIAVLTDSVEVQVFGGPDGPTLVGAVELVSPSNKDRLSEREAFVSKCAAYLQQGIGLVLIDVVTERRANLRAALLERLARPGPAASTADLYAAYHAVQAEGETTLNVWQEELTVGRPLPTMPLWLLGATCLPVELEATYERTCQEQRIRANGADENAGSSRRGQDSAQAREAAELHRAAGSRSPLAGRFRVRPHPPNPPSPAVRRPPTDAEGRPRPPIWEQDLLGSCRSVPTGQFPDRQCQPLVTSSFEVIP